MSCDHELFKGIVISHYDLIFTKMAKDLAEFLQRQGELRRQISAPYSTFYPLYRGDRKYRRLLLAQMEARIADDLAQESFSRLPAWVSQYLSRSVQAFPFDSVVDRYMDRAYLTISWGVDEQIT